MSEPQKPQTSRDRESMMQEELVGRCRASMSCERECTSRESMSANESQIINHCRTLILLPDQKHEIQLVQHGLRLEA